MNFIADKLVGSQEAEALTSEVCLWIESNLENDYAWPGNFRELEQCVKNILIQNAYFPQTLQADTFHDRVKDGRLTVEQLLSGYITRVYAQSKSYEKTARALDIDSRTVKRYLSRAQGAAL